MPGNSEKDGVKHELVDKELIKSENKRLKKSKKKACKQAENRMNTGFFYGCGDGI
ncbi:MAG TPA: hypothetical protein PLT66_01255 [Bacillota bacterium]|nr:hypothetical protein [Bacillota bacterium]